jgi:UDP-2,3-diacylglucosamine pyrophosphatase LpxH
MVKKRKLRRIWDILSWNDAADVIIVGHSHLPECVIWVDENGNIKTYANVGDWVSHTSYITVDEGVLRLKSFKQDNEQ